MTETKKETNTWQINEQQQQQQQQGNL